VLRYMTCSSGSRAAHRIPPKGIRADREGIVQAVEELRKTGPRPYLRLWGISYGGRQSAHESAAEAAWNGRGAAAPLLPLATRPGSTIRKRNRLLPAAPDAPLSSCTAPGIPSAPVEETSRGNCGHPRPVTDVLAVDRAMHDLLKARPRIFSGEILTHLLALVCSRLPRSQRLQ